MTLGFVREIGALVGLQCGREFYHGVVYPKPTLYRMQELRTFSLLHCCTWRRAHLVGRKDHTPILRGGDEARYMPHTIRGGGP